MSQWRPWLISAAITGGILWYLTSLIDLTAFIGTARRVRPDFVAVFVALLLAGVVVRALRFWVLLGRTTSLWVLCQVTLARSLFIDLLPARLGELSYVYLLTRRTNRTTEEGLASVLLAVLFDIVALVPLLIIAALAMGTGQLSVGTLTLLSLVLGLGAYLATRISGPAADRIARWLDDGTTTGRRGTVVRTLRSLAAALAAARTRRVVVPVLALSILVRLCKYGSYFMLVLAILAPLGYSMAELDFFRVFLGVLSAELAAALPIHGIAGFGTFEAVWTLSFTQLGFTQEHAIISGILTHVISQVVEYSLGACAFLYLMRPTDGR